MRSSAPNTNGGREGSHSVGGTSDNIDDGNGVEERPASDDVPESVGIV